MYVIEVNDFEGLEIIIRNYRPSDYQGTLEILKQLHEMYGVNITKKGWNKTSGLRQFKPNLKRITLVAELKLTGEIICMGVIEALRNNLGQYIGYLNNWATKKEFIGKQVGKILAERAIQILESWGCKAIRINLAYGVPEKLIRTFERSGFHPIMLVLEKRFEKGE